MKKRNKQTQRCLDFNDLNINTSNKILKIEKLINYQFI